MAYCTNVSDEMVSLGRWDLRSIVRVRRFRWAGWIACCGDMYPHVPNLTLYPHQLCKIVATFLYHFNSKATSVPQQCHMQTCLQNSHKKQTNVYLDVGWYADFALRNLICIFCTAKNTHHFHIMRWCGYYVSSVSQAHGASMALHMWPCKWSMGCVPWA